MKPKLTKEQQEHFEHQFKEIILQSSNFVQKWWKNEGKFNWIESNKLKIMPHGLVNKFQGKQADDFIILLNKYGLLYE